MGKFYYELLRLSNEICGQRTGKALDIKDVQVVFWFDS